MIDVCKLLPADARWKLIEASKTPVNGENNLARMSAIEKATEWVRFKYPSYFRVEKKPD